MLVEQQPLFLARLTAALHEEAGARVTSEPETPGVVDELPVAPETETPEQPTGAAQEWPVSPMGELPSGAAFGTLVHRVLEEVDFAAPDLRAALVDACTEAGAARFVGVPADVLAAAAEEETERVETALGLLASRYREGRSGIVLEHVAGGYAFRAAREAAEACARLVERPVQRGLSQAALETLAIVAYLGPVSRPEIARIRGVAADSAVAGLVERGLIAEAGRDKDGGAIRYEATPLFERVFGLTGLSELPRLDDLAGDDEGLRQRLEEVAGRRGA